jgi:hypothetical protein
MSTKFVTIILAGGLGKRMKSEIPKVLHLVNDKPMIYYPIQHALDLGCDKILIVVGKYKQVIEDAIEFWFPDRKPVFEFCIQEEVGNPETGELKVQGTGDAVKCCLSFFTENSDISYETKVLILSGDVPLLSKDTIGGLLSHDKNALLVTDAINPFGCGRIFYDDDDGCKISHIIEEKDCTEEERKNTIINCGVYNIQLGVLLSCIPLIKNENKNKEYYLTDLIHISKENGFHIYGHELEREKSYEIINVNSIPDLEEANNFFKRNNFIS